jgi:PknH-like extracellular domain
VPNSTRAVAALALIAVVSACSGGAHDKTPPPTVSASGLNDLLLGVDQINSVMGTNALVADPPFTELKQDQALMPNVNCLGIWQVGEQGVYGDTGLAGIRGQRMSQPKPENWDALVVQAVVAYPSADDARKFFTASTDRWSKCTNHRVNLSVNGGPPTSYMFGDLTKNDTQLTMPINQNPAGKPCQHALSVDGNVIVDVSACSQGATDQAAQIAQKIEDRFPH